MAELINLDDLCVDAKSCRKEAMKIGQEFAALHLQQEYLLEKAKAMDYRKNGEIQEAMQTERWMECIYKKLPENLQW